MERGGELMWVDMLLVDVNVSEFQKSALLDR